MFLTRSSDDGSDAYPIEGMYLNEKGNIWSNKPFTKEQRANHLVYQHGFRYKKSYREIYDSIKAGSKECLPLWVRKWLVENFENID